MGSIGDASSIECRPAQYASLLSKYSSLCGMLTGVYNAGTSDEFFHDITFVRRIVDRYGPLEARLPRAVQSGQTIRSIQDLMSREG